MTRVVAGRAKGRTLKVPASGTRPTSERVREAMFSSLEHRGFIDGCEVLDLYAGSGALGIEAASRGAIYVECVESAPKAAALIRQNAVDLPVVVTNQKAETWVKLPANRAYDLAFLDPPYDLPENKLTEVLEGLLPHLAHDAAIVVERSSRSPEPTWPAGMELTSEKKWGDTRAWTGQVTQHPSVNNRVTDTSQ
ncbi:16S rRNA (guanine(966)-N(2))-methyltransferase RsmD [Ancrocorticia populi]|uniref:16S rRNA (guanine(966)-N(2))-methyltransferase RsmD n=1 Tax=Ancrocorticia populi TaxID=2175228 RepID=UPI0023561316|nr:16S rRNA (guanine(966)-N(2))-methyltransferase RsmD [Ancrocorticia populi]